VQYIGPVPVSFRTPEAGVDLGGFIMERRVSAGSCMPTSLKPASRSALPASGFESEAQHLDRHMFLR
jgi:hypothetical protein